MVRTSGTPPTGGMPGSATGGRCRTKRPGSAPAAALRQGERLAARIHGLVEATRVHDRTTAEDERLAHGFGRRRVSRLRAGGDRRRERPSGLGDPLPAGAAVAAAAGETAAATAGVGLTGALPTAAARFAESVCSILARKSASAPGASPAFAASAGAAAVAAAAARPSPALTAASCRR